MKTPVVIVAAALLLGGCGWMPHHEHPIEHLGAQLHQRPLVVVKGGLVSVSPEPVVVQPSAGDRAVTFRLPPGTRFDGAGIVVLGRLVDAKGEPLPPTQKTLESTGGKLDERAREAFACRVAADQQSATCTPGGKPGARGVYKYQIRVVHQGRLLTWDPNILHLD